MRVLRVTLQVLGQVGDPLVEHGDLDLGGAGVRVAAPVLGDGIVDFCSVVSAIRSGQGYQPVPRRPRQAPAERRTGWPSETTVAGSRRPIVPFGRTTASATAVVDPATDRLGQTKLPSPW